MKTTTNTKFKVLTPSKGKVITQKNVEDESGRILAHQICIPLDKPTSEWIEWTEAQAEEWERQYMQTEEEEIETEDAFFT